MRRQRFDIQGGRNFDLQQLIPVGQRRQVGDIEMGEDLQQGTGRMLRAINDRAPRGVPPAARTQASCTGQVPMIADTPDIHAAALAPPAPLF